MPYDLSAPWNEGVKGEQVLPLINDDAPVIRVEAGPGTGKTFGLVRRVLRILHPQGLNCAGKKVAVVAFNRVIAKQLSKEIKEELKKSGYDELPLIQTVHGFCLRLVGEETRILLPHEREAMLYDILCEYLQVEHAVENYAGAEQALHDHEAKIHEWPELWQAVQLWLTRHKARLISDLPGLLLDRIKGGDFASSQFEHVIVDEFQDLTPAEQELFLKLRAAEGELVALGDPRQSIYAFLGNERKGLAKLAEHPLLAGIPIHDCPMTECQRCPTEIVSAANKLMTLAEAMPMTPISETQAEILVVYWKTPASEAKGMAALIMQKIHSSPVEQTHLAMVSRRQFGYSLRDELAKLDPKVAVELGFSESILELWPVREAFLFFCLLTDPDPPTWRAWLGYCIPSYKHNHLAPKRNARAYLNFLKRCDDHIRDSSVLGLCGEPRIAKRGEGGCALWDRACRFRDLLQSKSWNGFAPGDFVRTALNPEMWVNDGADDAPIAKLDLGVMRDNALQILTDLETQGKIKDRDDQLRQVARQLRYSIATREPLATESESRLKITTLWGAKGLTAHHVYILGLCREAIPGVRTPQYPGTDADYYEEQRRLFYVSITRPRETLILSRPKKIKPGDAQKLNLRIGPPNFHYSELQMCPFLRDIIDTVPAAVDGERIAEPTGRGHAIFRVPPK